MKNKVLITAGIAVAAFATTTSIMCACSSADADRIIKETDAFIEAHEIRTSAFKATPAPKYTFEEMMIAKVVGFEVGYCCDTCKHYVASACINRMNGWYSGDVVDMISDGNDEYYYMNPMYVTATEVNGWNYYDHSEEILPVVQEAEVRTADIWYWDCDETQSDWADLVFVCHTDHMFFYR